MTDSALLFSSLDCSDTPPPLEDSRPSGQPFVRRTPESLSEMSDAELQSYIAGCAEQFLAAQERWNKTGCFAAIGDRDGWWTAEVEALVERGSRNQLVTREAILKGRAVA